jgi:plastocyanin
MTRRVDGLILGLALTAALAACGGGSSYGGGGGSNPPPGGGGSGTPPPTGVAANTIGVALPTGPIGTVNTPFGLVGGYTQKTYSQVLAFAPGTVVTIKNLSATNAHTLNVLSMSSFPVSPSLSTAASGGNTLSASYASGSIAPGGSVQVTLANAGTYYIGCAFHYMDSPSMRDVLIVSANATPGPQATAQPSSGGGTPPGGGGYGY